MKAGVPCCVDPHQKAEALEVIARRGRELGSLPVLAPGLQDLQWAGGLASPTLGLYGEVQSHNASLAVALTSHFLAATGGETQGEDRARAVVTGLERTEWPGRSQTITRDSVQFYLDGAHTEESMASCHQWFSHQATQTDSARVSRVLIFNTTGDREVRCLLSPLASLQLDLVIFCTNISRQASSASVDQQNFNTNYQIQLARCETHSEAWRDLSTDVPCLTVPCYDEAVLAVTATRLKDLQANLQADLRPSLPLSIPASVSQAETLQILVTGSLHLVGAVLGLLQR